LPIVISVARLQMFTLIVPMKHVIFCLFSAKHVKLKWIVVAHLIVKEINSLPYQQQKLLRRGQGNSNDIFKKGRAEHLSKGKDLRNIFNILNKD
jgi:hypothetical protein